MSALFSPAVAPVQMSMATSVITHTGRVVDLLTPRPEAIDLLDIARSLSRLPRFNGHLRGMHPYSVAEHSLTVARLLPPGADDRLRLAALLHDAHEAYVGDISRPMLQAIRLVYAAGADAIGPWIVAPIQAAIHERFGLPSILPHEWREAIALADDQALRAEAEAFLARPVMPEAWSWVEDLPSLERWRDGVRLPSPADDAMMGFIRTARIFSGEGRP